jgi:putative two-component system response regulator
MQKDYENKIDNDIISILCVDDSRSQLEKYRFDLKDFFDLSFAENYEEAISIITMSKPDIILLDINMPGTDGLQFLSILKSHSVFHDIEVIMISSETDIDKVHISFVTGAADYIKKPYNGIELKLRINNVIKSLKEKRQNNEYRQISELMQNEYKAIIKDSKNSIVFALIELARSRDNDTGDHLKRIMKYNSVLSESMSNTSKYKNIFTDEIKDDICIMSALHDIGKISIPDSILQKPGKLSGEEYEIIKKHTILGGRMLEKVYKSNKNCKYLKTAMDIALHHHEKWNGKGYPYGLAGEAIPVSARIVAVSDIFDALSTKRVYKKAFKMTDVLIIMQSEKNNTFDPFIYEIFDENKEKFINIRDEYSPEE